MSEPHSLSAEALRAALIEPYIGNEIVVVAQTTSTNDFAWQMALEGRAPGLVVIAERQTAGRGQRGNRWESAPHFGLWFSILLRPNIEPADSERLISWAVQSVATTIAQEVEIAPKTKFPNDIFLSGKKVAGVLVEMRVEKNGSYAAIIGIGLNVNQTDADFSKALQGHAGSLATAAGREIDRQALALALLRNLDQTYRELFAV